MDLDKIPERIKAKIDFEGPGGCWIWKGYVDPQGYGQLCYNGKPHIRPQRMIYEIMVGVIPAGLTLDHLCRNRACVHPKHLEPVSNKENVLRGTGLSAENARKIHCKRGHEFTIENTYIRRTPRGIQRLCRKCRKLHASQRIWIPGVRRYAKQCKP